jgi:Zn finger protein HypA/HybF involved in hydrogenase expression
MAFFDDLSKKISQAGQSAVQKGKEVADLAKLNSLVSDEKKRINENYLQIGKIYVELHDSSHGADFDNLINAIHESESKIKEYQQQIKDIKGVVKCEKCGAEVASNAAFCSSCGAPMPVVKPVEEEHAEAAPAEAPSEQTDASDSQQNS